MLSRLRQAGLVWPTILALGALAVLLSLGTWQLQRKAWKEEIVATVAARAKSAPFPYDRSFDQRCRLADAGLAASCEYLRLRLKGRFEHAGERHVFAGAQGSGSRAEVGYWVFTPFVPDGAPHWFYVNRGFVPERLKSAAGRGAGQVSGIVEIVAQLRTREPRPTFAAQNDAARNVYFVRDPAEFGGDLIEAGNQRIGPHPVFYLEIVESEPPGGYPKPLAGTVNLPNRHLEYALTWYGLALTLIGVYIAFARARLA